MGKFQSAPLTDVRGDGLDDCAAKLAKWLFQSAPLTDVREIILNRPANKANAGFNPLPSRM